MTLAAALGVSLRSFNSASSFPFIHCSALFTRQITMDAKSVASQLKSSGLLRTQGLIGGKWTDAYDGKTIEVRNPATGEVIADVSCMGQKETNDAISSAYNAYNSWSKLTATERSKSLRKWYDLLVAHKEELGQLITLEQGKPLKEALGEISYGAGFLEFFSEEAKRIYGDIIPPALADRRLFVLKQPVGVVGAITPWNFPLAMITRKVGPALACGCTVVIKPSELTPLTALAAAELSLQAGIPPGVVNVVMGNAPDIGNALLASPQVRKITFTGSTAVGKKLMAGAAGTVKKVSLELGGNAPCIVFDDADVDVAVKGAVYSLSTMDILWANGFISVTMDILCWGKTVRISIFNLNASLKPQILESYKGAWSWAPAESEGEDDDMENSKEEANGFQTRGGTLEKIIIEDNREMGE
ncbi:Succinate-semialdehyde dehydrogenase [Morus notabilis]|uniref:Succinate-semialdehyde dehydrogenase n=1 Tax=Morus notabilis TaxID=981085 RepID=W9RD35_9ROSA|nr:Succinate-semialdehyde dehydrogenase [Morus notabilis]